MNNCFLFLAIAVFGAQAFLHNRILLREWDKFKSTHKKNYSAPEEEQYRLGIFEKKLRQIEKHNSDYRQGLVSYQMGINQFSDLNEQEQAKFTKTFSLKNLPTNKYRDEYEGYEVILNMTAPRSVDWRRANIFGPVKNQKHCGSCWAFAAVACLEAYTKLYLGKEVVLSEQNLVDCSTQNYGCDGGHPILAYEYIISNGGIASEKAYSYEGVQKRCRYHEWQKAATLSRYGTQYSKGEEYLKKFVAQIGPVVVGMCATNKFMSYGSGIYDDPYCPDALNHAVVVVGYGTHRGIDYWWVRNSWGRGWGEDGYFRIKRNANNQCGIATEVIYPVVP